MDRAARLRGIPSVERLLECLAGEGVLDAHPRRLVVECVREAAAAARRAAADGEPPAVEAILAAARARIIERSLPGLRRAINATGVVLHTNLGRAPLAEAARDAVAAAAAGYSTLEIDLETGRRGSRHRHARDLLRGLTGAEDAVVVNNNAGAVLLAIAALAAGREVIVSRGELVEIGGSFRMPDVMAAGGARLVEVGTTNKTYVRDYERAIAADAALLLKVHRSNFRMTGFVHEVSAGDLVDLGRRRGIPVMYDLGSGALLPLSRAGLTEPTAPEAVAAGCDLVTFSADKLLGGPQAGIAVGGRETVERLRGHPLMRALRPDKLTLAALDATLRLSLDPGRAWEAIPVLRMLAAPLEGLRATAGALADRVRGAVGGAAAVGVEDVVSEAGGGSLPGVALPSAAVVVRPAAASPAAWAAALLRHDPPVVCRVAGNAIVLDVRTLLPDDHDPLVEAFRVLR